MGCSSCAKAAAQRIGNQPSQPIVLDGLTAETARQATRVRVLNGAELGVPDGAVKYVSGTGIAAFEAEGWIAPLSGDPRGTGISPGRRWYQVGRLGYLTLPPAQVRSEQVGEPIAERTVED